VELDGGPVTILPRRAPIGNSAPIRGRSLTVVPGSSEREGYPAILDPGTVPAVGLLGLTEGRAIELGRALELAEVLFWDGRRAAMLDCR
jgi:hypothetical protein